jgi:hypothetical protein
VIFCGPSLIAILTTSLNFPFASCSCHVFIIAS